MHSSRMRTGRSLTVCCSLLPGGALLGLGGGFLPGLWGGFSLVPGGVLPGLGGVCLGPGGSVPGPGGCLPWSLVRGGDPRDPPCTESDTCKNITLATTSLRPVIMKHVVRAILVRRERLKRRLLNPARRQKRFDYYVVEWSLASGNASENNGL